MRFPHLSLMTAEDFAAMPPRRLSGQGHWVVRPRSPRMLGRRSVRWSPSRRPISRSSRRSLRAIAAPSFPPETLIALKGLALAPGWKVRGGLRWGRSTELPRMAEVDLLRRPRPARRGSDGAAPRAERRVVVGLDDERCAAGCRWRRAGRIVGGPTVVDMLKANRSVSVVTGVVERRDRLDAVLATRPDRYARCPASR